MEEYGLVGPKYGVSPIGGKSVFPINWSIKDILDAILGVLDHPEPFVLRPKSKKGAPEFYLRSLVNNVYVEVGIKGESVNTAFPSWRQDRPAAIGEAYREWHLDECRVQEGLVHGSFSNDFDFPTKIHLPTEFLAGYFGKCPSGITAKDWERLEPWLNPSRVADAAWPLEGLTLQFTIFDYIYRSRVVQELEGVITVFG